jgi:iron complex outermembrane receptor protein
LILGGAWNKYDDARHYGEIIWAEYAAGTKPGDPYYDNTGFKTDFNIFLKGGWSPVTNLTLYGDMQYRRIIYKANGIESHQNNVAIDEKFDFFNPKLGISYSTRAGMIYASYGIAHREPIRDDYTDAQPGEKPEPETLGNLELGLRRSTSNLSYSVNYFLMNYHNQLVLTGEINDDGAYVRKNTGKSYRTGIELSAGYRVNSHVQLDGNISLMNSKTDYTWENPEGELTVSDRVDISFSPRVVGAAQLRMYPVKNLEFDWQLKFVGNQYLNNTGNEELSLEGYTVNDLRLGYLLPTEKAGQFELTLLVNNIFNVKYESNGYVYDYSPYYYPQAGTNFMAGFTVRF